MTPDPLNDPIINYGWRRCEEEVCQEGDECMECGQWVGLPRPKVEHCRGDHGYPVRRRIQPPDGMELIGLDEDMVDGAAALFTDGEKGFWRHPRDFKRYTAREIVLKRSAASDVAVAAFFRPIKIMSEPKEYYRAIKQTSATREDDGTTVKGESLIGYFEGDSREVYAFIEANGYWPSFRLEPITFRKITQKDIDDLKAAKIALDEATAALKAIKV
jgi:hypothetical protein